MDVSIGTAINLAGFAEAAAVPEVFVLPTRSLSQIKQVELSGGNVHYLAWNTFGSRDSWLQLVIALTFALKFKLFFLVLVVVVVFWAHIQQTQSQLFTMAPFTLVSSDLSPSSSQTACPAVLTTAKTQSIFTRTVAGNVAEHITSIENENKD